MGGAAFPVLFLSVFLACCVEAVEALTVVLAPGVTRGLAGKTVRGRGRGGRTGRNSR